METDTEFWRHDEVHGEENRNRNQVGHTGTSENGRYRLTTVQVFIPEQDPELWGLVRLTSVERIAEPKTRSRKPDES